MGKTTLVHKLLEKLREDLAEMLGFSHDPMSPSWRKMERVVWMCEVGILPQSESL